MEDLLNGSSQLNFSGACFDVGEICSAQSTRDNRLVEMLRGATVDSGLLDPRIYAVRSILGSWIGHNLLK